MTRATAPAAPGSPNLSDADFVSTYQFKSPVDSVLVALTDPERLSRWWTKASGSGEQGRELTFFFGDEKLVVRVDEANRSIVQWTPLVSTAEPGWLSTTIAFTLSQRQNGGTDMIFRHAGLARLECFDSCRTCWKDYLLSLVDYVDVGQGRPRER